MNRVLDLSGDLQNNSKKPLVNHFVRLPRAYWGNITIAMTLVRKLSLEGGLTGPKQGWSHTKLSYLGRRIPTLTLRQLIKVFFCMGVDL